MPRLTERVKIDLRTGEVDVFDHGTGGRVSVLMGKSRFMSGLEKRYEERVRFDLHVARGLGDDMDTVPFGKSAERLLKAGLQPPY